MMKRYHRNYDSIFNAARGVSVVKVLITGGARFIGCHLSRRFIEQDYEVAVVYMRYPYYLIERTIHWFKAHEGD